MAPYDSALHTAWTKEPPQAPELHELLTVKDVAALLKVSKSWVYEHTRARSTPREERLPHIRIGKYLRFDVARCARVSRAQGASRARRGPHGRTMAAELNPEEPTRRKDIRMARTKTAVRQWRSDRTEEGVGYSLAGGGNRSRRHNAKGAALRGAGANVAACGGSDPGATRGGGGSRKQSNPLARALRCLTAEWKRTVLPMYKASTQKNHRHIAGKHLVPRFGVLALMDVTTQEIQSYVAQLSHDGYAPKTIDHIHDVLSAILRTGVKWGHLKENPARGVSMPTLRTVRPKWALTIPQGKALMDSLPPLARTLTGLALLTGLRRGELFALRWKAVDLADKRLTVQEAVYEGAFGTPKTEAGMRAVPLADGAAQLLDDWRARREAARSG